MRKLTTSTSYITIMERYCVVRFVLSVIEVDLNILFWNQRYTQGPVPNDLGQRWRKDRPDIQD